MLHKLVWIIWYLPGLFIVTSSLLCLNSDISFRNVLHTKKKKSQILLKEKVVLHIVKKKKHITFQI